MSDKPIVVVDVQLMPEFSLLRADMARLERAILGIPELRRDVHGEEQLIRCITREIDGIAQDMRLTEWRGDPAARFGMRRPGGLRARKQFHARYRYHPDFVPIPRRPRR